MITIKNEALIVLEVAKSLKPGESRTFVYGSTPVANPVRNELRKRLTRLGIGGNIKTAVDGNSLVVYKKEKSYQKRLEDMIKRLMWSTEDRKLYDEALKLLEESING